MTTTHPAGTMEVRGQRFPLAVNDTGTWSTLFAGETVYGDTRAQLATKLLRLTKEATATVSVPFTTLHPSAAQVLRGAATGIHSRTKNILLRWEGGGTEQLDRYDHRAFLEELAPEQEREWVALVTAAREAARAKRAFEDAHRLNLRDAVKAAVDKAVASAGEAEGEQPDAGS